MATKKDHTKVLQQIDQLKARAKSVNDSAIEATDNLVDLSLKAGKQWQTLLAKTLKSGTNLLSQQQDMVFETLETLKDQYQSGAKRVQKLVNIELPIQPLDTPLIARIRARKEAATEPLRKASKRKAKVESLFHEAGIQSYEQLAQADLKTLRSILEQAGPRYRSHNPSNWRQQAKLAAKGQWAQLKKLQAKLKSERKAKK